MCLNFLYTFNSNADYKGQSITINIKTLFCVVLNSGLTDCSNDEQLMSVGRKLYFLCQQL